MTIEKKLWLKGLPWLGVLLWGACCSPKQEVKQVQEEDLYQNLPFAMEKVIQPVIPARNYSILDFGGVGDGITLNTQAFAQAIDSLEKAGGGRLTVPAGVWYTGPIVLKSNIELHLADRALLLFSADKDDYPLVKTVFEGLETRRCQSPLSAWQAKNIAITGNGTIDGSGAAWRPVKKSKLTDSQWKNLLASGGVVNEKGNMWYPSAGSAKGHALSDMNVPRQLTDEAEWAEIRDFLRPVMISLRECEQILLEGVTFQNSPSWNIHPFMCKHLTVRGVTVRNPWYSQNGDGIDIESCQNVLLVNSTFDVGDDGICIKSGKDEEGRRRAAPTSEVLVDNCIVFHAHGGFVVGSEMSGGVRNIRVTNCQFLGTDVGLRFKSKRGRGGVVENIYISNIHMADILTEPLLFDLYYNGKSAVESLNDGDLLNGGEKQIPVTEETPVFRNIFIDNLQCRRARRAMFFNGLPEMNIARIEVKNAAIAAEQGAEISESDGVKLENLKLVVKEGPALILKNTRNVKIENWEGITSSGDPLIAVEGKNTQAIQFLSSGVTPENIVWGKQADKAAVSFE